MKTTEELIRLYNDKAERVLAAATAVMEAEADAPNKEELRAKLTTAEAEATAAKNDMEERAALERSILGFKPVVLDKDGEKVEFKDDQRAGIHQVNKVDEPDMYREDAQRSFMTDLYWSAVKPNDDPTATKRIRDHQQYELEKRAVTTTTLGGIIPPDYLLELYAKAARNGRVFADQINHQPMPPEGMSIIVPRLTVGLAAASQATENTTVTTQDPTEVDLSVPVRTIAGYSPVSRQTIERNAYRDNILFEDLVARYFAQLDTQVINGSGASGQLLGLLGTSGIATSSTATATVAALYPKMADVIQQINTSFGGLGYVADKIFMHPRRWGFFTAAVDSASRPLIVPSAQVTGSGDETANALGTGMPVGYGRVGSMFGLPVFTDANIPTNLGGGTNEDRIIILCSAINHLWERTGDPVTLSFEQTTGTALQINLVVYGYAAYTGGRYPGASGAVSGAGLVTPTF